MGQKVNPISLRLEKTNRHFDSCWYDDYNYTDLLLQDLRIKNYLKIVLNQIKYPEGRVLIENLPNKSNINLFYCNPSLSRQKKNKAFVLQDINKIKTKNKKQYQKLNEKHWKDDFTLSQQTLEEWKNSVYPLTVCAFPLHGTNNQNLLLQYISKKKSKNKYTVGTNKVAQNLSRKGILYLPSVPSETGQVTDHNQSVHPFKGHDKQKKTPKTKSLSCLKSTKETYAEFLNKGIKKSNTLCVPCVPSYKQGEQNNINLILLQFILEEREKVKEAEKQKQSIHSFMGLQKKEIDKKWVKERFFIRYLLAQLYGKFLQNKSVYSQESLHTLYQWLIFFQERNRLVVDPNYASLLGTQNISKKKGFSFSFGKKGYGDQPEETPKEGHREYNRISEVRKKRIVDPKNDLGTTLYPYKQIARGLYSLYPLSRVYKSYLESFLCKQYRTFFNLVFFRSGTEKQGALFLVEDIIYYLERKIPFRRIKSQILKEIPRYTSIRGIRITCSGRVGGRSKKAQRSKIQSVKIGQTPLGVFSSKIDFASKSALTRFGLIGVKVWVCYQ